MPSWEFPAVPSWPPCSGPRRRDEGHRRPVAAGLGRVHTFPSPGPVLLARQVHAALPRGLESLIRERHRFRSGNVIGPAMVLLLGLAFRPWASAVNCPGHKREWPPPAPRGGRSHLRTRFVGPRHPTARQCARWPLPPAHSPWGGLCAYRHILGPAGSAVVAAQESIELRRLAYRQDKALEIAHSQPLSRTVGANCHKATVT